MRISLVVALTCWWAFGTAPAHSIAVSSDAVDGLATVHITDAVLAGGKPLPPGTYELRLTGDGPPALAGQPPGSQRWVELVAGGTVVAREVAEVLRDDDLTPIGASSQKARLGTRVEKLKGGEFLRISVKREGVRYLVHLPLTQ